MRCRICDAKLSGKQKVNQDLCYSCIHEIREALDEFHFMHPDQKFKTESIDKIELSPVAKKNMLDAVMKGEYDG